MIAPVLARLYDQQPLAPSDARRTFDALLDPGRSEAERVAVLAVLTARPDSTADLAAFAREMRRRARPFPVPRGDGAVDLCGSGGAPRRSFNVSTVSAFVVAAAGVPVVKHGNRSARGPCGSSDVLEALGLPVVDDLGFARRSYRKFGLAFLHAPLFHPATRAVGEARRLLGVPTLFNRLGPLSNPGNVPFQVVGVPDRATARRTAEVLARLGTRRSLAITAPPGYDEFSPTGTTHGFRQDGPRLRPFEVRAVEYLAPDDRRGGWGPLDPPHAAAEAERLLAGGGGARRGSVLLTSGASIWIAGRAATLRDGIARAREALDLGRVERLLFDLRALAGRTGGRG